MEIEREKRKMWSRGYGPFYFSLRETGGTGLNKENGVGMKRNEAGVKSKRNRGIKKT